MFQLGKTIISEDVIQKDFVCNLSACKGACCIDGDAGAPLEESETKVLEEIYPIVKSYLRQDGIKAIEEQGKVELKLLVADIGCLAVYPDSR